MLTLPQNHKFRFPVTGQFGRSAPNDSKMTLNTKMSQMPYICSISISESQIPLFGSTTSHFQDIAPFHFPLATMIKFNI